MTENERKEKALLKYRVIEPLVTGQIAENISNTQFYKDAADKTYTDSYGNDIKVSWQCISKWHQSYRKGGFDALLPKPRNDRHTSRKLDEDVIRYIRLIRSEYPRLPATVIYTKLIDNGIADRNNLSLSTVTRFVRNMKVENGEHYRINEMRRYEREHINEVWCGDSSVGPYIKIDGKKQRTYIIALIDDASRMVVGIDIFLNDNFINLMSVIRKAVAVYGKPKVFNFDNGANYRSNQMVLLGARMGCAINYCAPYTPTSKAKIERWFRTMKDHWMAGLNMNEYDSLGKLGDSLREYVSMYNQSIHTSLNGKSPQDRFFEEAHIIKRYSEEEMDKMFMLEIERKVSNDNVVVIDGTEYEVHYKYAGMKLTLRYTPDLKRIYVYDSTTGECEELVLLDKKSNSRSKRIKVKLSE